MRAALLVMMCVTLACLPRRIIDCQEDSHCNPGRVCVAGACQDEATSASSSAGGPATSTPSGGSMGSSTAASASSSMRSSSSVSTASSGAGASSSGGTCTVPQAFANVVTQDLQAVWGAGDCDVWAVGNSNTVLHWDGTLLRAVGGPEAGLDLYAVYADANLVLVMGGDSAAFRTFVKSGTGWNERNPVVCDNWHPRVMPSHTGELWLACPDASSGPGDIHLWDAAGQNWIGRREGRAVWQEGADLYIAAQDGVHRNGQLMDGSYVQADTVAVVDGVLTSWRVTGNWNRHQLLDGGWVSQPAPAVFNINRFSANLFVAANGYAADSAVVWDGNQWVTITSGTARVDDVAVTQQYVWMVRPGGELLVFRR